MHVGLLSSKELVSIKNDCGKSGSTQVLGLDSLLGRGTFEGMGFSFRKPRIWL